MTKTTIMTSMSMRTFWTRRSREVSWTLHLDLLIVILVMIEVPFFPFSTSPVLSHFNSTPDLKAFSENFRMGGCGQGCEDRESVSEPESGGGSNRPNHST